MIIIFLAKNQILKNNYVKIWITRPSDCSTILIALPTHKWKQVDQYVRGETKQTWILQFSYIVHRQHLVELPKREISKSETSIARNNKGFWFEASKFVELPSGNWWSSFHRNHCRSVLPSWLFGLGGWVHRSGHLLCSVRLSDLWPNLRCSRRKPIFYIRFFCPPYSSA